MNPREEKFFSQSKRERILYLARIGFNTAKFLGTVTSIKDLAVFFKENKGNKISIRTQNLYKPIMCPHYPFVSLDKDLLQKLETLVRKKHDLLMFEPINPRDAIKRGNLWINKGEGKIGIEYKDSPGTVRQLENEEGLKRVESTIEDMLTKEANGLYFLGYLPSKFINLPFSQFIIEFSVYNHPVGTQQKSEIFWEIRAL